MKNVIVLCFLIAVTVAFSPPNGEEDHPRYHWIPDGKGEMHYVDLLAEPSEPSRFNPDADIVYLLFTRKNPTQGQIIKRGNLQSLQESNFDAKKPVKFTIHGWTEDKDSGTNIVITDAFLKAMDVNMITVDWSAGSKTDYSEAAKNVVTAGASVAGFVDWLNTQGVAFSNVHLVGHSLGGQMVGVVGRSCKNGKAEYITSLDPAFPGWTSSSARVRKTDGKYVEVIHSCVGVMGMVDAVGHNDFYPNSGTPPMPGCGSDVLCSHERSREYFASSLDNQKFVGKQCKTVAEATGGVEKCTGDKTLYMGGSKIKAEMGIFAFKTNADKPYYQ